MRYILVLFLVATGCAPVERASQSCLNQHAAAGFGRVVAHDDGFEVIGSGAIYSSMEITQETAAPVPGMIGDPRNSYPKVYMRFFRCEMIAPPIAVGAKDG